MLRKKYVISLSAGLLVLLLASASTQKYHPLTAAKLGERLFFDPILSEDSSISCASCHKPEFAFADTVALSKGVHGRTGTRNAPSAMNMSARESFFWDGRAASLEEQALAPISNPVEMNLPVHEAIARLRRSPAYRRMFLDVYKRLPDAKALASAIAAFERTLETSDTPNDHWLNEEADSMNVQQIRGRTIFREKARCFECHFSPDFTGDEFRSIGLFNGRQYADSGRYKITRKPEDLGKMKVPGLRNIAMTAPYMHDGSFKTLREVIDYYDNPMVHLPDGMNRDSLLREPLNLSEEEKQDLEAFLHALTDKRFLKKS